MTAIGIDIGTTSISVIHIDINSGKVLKSVTAPNKSNIDEYTQAPDIILSIVYDILNELITDVNDVKCIGITGQMHGIVYVDDYGNSVSPLYTWRNTFGNEMYKDNLTYSEFLSQCTESKIATGYGFTTLYYHMKKGLLPSTAFSFASIPDYIAMKLTNSKKPLVHISNAHSFGLYDLKKNNFDIHKVKKAGLDILEIPYVTDKCVAIGEYKGIPVSVAIGDNQAGFIGSIKDYDNTVLVNIGTGSQVSFVSNSLEPGEGLEVRPLVKDKYIEVGSSLCGGSALGILETFFRQVASYVTGKTVDSAYPGINRAIDEIIEKGITNTTLNVSTLFLGTRGNPNLRGSIANITTNNLTVNDFLIGFMQGMVNELFELYRQSNLNHIYMVGAGNGIGKNKLIQKLVSDTFGKKLLIPAHTEQTAYGAVLFGLISSGYFSSIDKAGNLINFKENEEIE